jgi:hypothetical protein
MSFGITNASGTSQYIYGTTQYANGLWYYVVATWDATTVSIYVNGQLDISTPNTIGAVRASSGPLIIGAQLDNLEDTFYGDLGFNGIITGVNVFNRALTSTEIASRYQNYNAGGTGLGAYLMSAASRNVPLIAGFIILLLLGSIYLYNRKRAREEK